MAQEEKPHEELSRTVQADLATTSATSISTEKIYLASEAKELRQGEILTDLIQLVVDLDSIKSGDGLVVKAKRHPLAIVVSQDCDLTQDFKVRQEGKFDSDKILPSIMFCEVISASELLGKGLGKDQWNRVKRNKDERYQFLETVPPDCDALGNGLPELGVDFKRYFSMPTDEVYYRLETEARRRCYFTSPYLEHFSTRFCYFQFRVALPADHHSE